MNPQNKKEKISHWNSEIIINWELTTEEKQKIIDFLNKRKIEEKNLVLVISKNEIADLRDALWREPDWLNEFLESQEKETITSSEIMQWSEVEKKLWWPEKLKVYLDIWDEASYKYFFEWKNAIFKWLNISEDAKRNFSTWANFFIINYLNKKIENANLRWDIWKIATELLWTSSDKWLLESLPELLWKWEWLINSLEWKWKLISEISFWDIWKTFDSFFGSEKLKVLSEAMKDIELEDNWEQNWIFMNPLESHNFMKYIFETENITKEQIKNYIESKNWKNIEIEENQKNELKNIWDKISSLITPEMWGILWKWLEIKQFYEESKDSIKESIIWNKTALTALGFLKEIPWIWEMISMFLWFLWIDNIDEILSGKDFEASKKSIEENILKDWSIFEWKKIPENFMKDNSWKNDTNFLDNINYIIWEKEWSDFWKEIEKLFKKDWEFINFYDSIKQDLKLWDLLNSDSINYEELKKAIKIFKNYKIESKNDPSITPEIFIQKINEQQNQTEQKQKQINGLLLTENLKIELVNAEEKFEINDNEIEYIFESNWTKYKVNLFNNWELTINGWLKIVKFNWANEIFQWIVKFKWRLEEKAIAKDFWEENFLKKNIKLEKTIKDILLNWFHDSIYWEKIDKNWLKDEIVNNFINSEWLKNEDVNFKFNDKSITLTKVSSNGFWIKDNDETDITEKENKVIDNDEKTRYNLDENWNLKIKNGESIYEIKVSWKDENWLIISIDDKTYKLDETYNIDLITDYPKFSIEEEDWEYNLKSDWIHFKINDLIKWLNDNWKFTLKEWIIQDLILEKV